MSPTPNPANTAAAVHPDPIDTFNTQLAHAKINALRVLQELIASFTDPEATVGAALREIRLAAAAILRTRPLQVEAAARKRAHQPPAPTSAPDSSPPVATPPTPHSNPDLNPTRRAAIRDVRNLLRDGNPHMIRAMLAPAPSPYASAVHVPPPSVPTHRECHRPRPRVARELSQSPTEGAGNERSGGG